MKLIIREDRMLLAARQNAALLDISKRLEGRRRWAKNGLTIETTGSNIELLTSEIEGIKVVDKRDNKTIMSLQPKLDIKFKTEPYPHQVVALEKLAHQVTYALFMEQGTGKSKVILDWAHQLNCAGLIYGLLVIAPKGVHIQWIEDQAEQHMSGEWDGGWWPNTPNLRADALNIYTMNYDALRSKKGMATAKEFIHSCGGNVLLALDESHCVKNSRTQRWLNCKELRDRVSHCVLATGTPIAKDLCDEWSQMKLLDEDILGIRYLTHFRNEYCIMGGYQGRAVVGTRNLDRFKMRTEPYVYRVRKADIGIEPKQYSVWKFDMTPKQRNLYRQTAQQALLEIDNGEIKTIEHAVVRILHMQQISNGFIDYIDIDPDLRRETRQRIELFPSTKENPRIQALLECMENLEEEPAIVWCRFQYDVQQVAQALMNAEISHVRYYGLTPEKERQKNLKSFLRGDARAFVATPGSGGTGLNLQGLCTNAIYYSNSENSIQRWQSEDRIHRIGIRQPITYTDLVARGSRDLPILANLRRKKSISDMTLGDLKAELEKIV